MTNKLNTSAAQAARDIIRRKNQVDVSVSEATATASTKNNKPKSRTRKKQGISAKEALKSEYIGSEGEKSYGQKMGKPIVSKRKTRFSTDESIQ